MKWKPFSGGVPYTCKDCLAFKMQQLETEKWRLIAERFYNALPDDVQGREYAILAYEQAVRGG